MDRRKALKQMGALAATTAYSTSILSLLASCKDDAAKNLAWKPISLNAKESTSVSKLLDAFIPSGEIPGALDVGVDRFMDTFMANVMSDEDKERSLKGLKAFMDNYNSTSDISLADSTTEDVQAYILSQFKSHSEKVKNAAPGQKIENPVVEYLYGVRGMGLWAWKNSKTIATEHMWYDPIPQKFVGCRDLNSEGDGKMMSLS